VTSHDGSPIRTKASLSTSFARLEVTFIRLNDRNWGFGVSNPNGVQGQSPWPIPVPAYFVQPVVAEVRTLADAVRTRSKQGAVFEVVIRVALLFMLVLPVI
jgi:hypothetical protein